MMASFKLLVIYSFIFTNAAFCWTVSPSKFTLQEGKASYYYLTINAQDATEATPIEIYAAKRMIDKWGKNTWERIEDKVLIYPSVCVVPPGGTQQVRVFWKGNFKDIKQEEAYRVILAGLPVPVKENQMKEVDKGIKMGIKVLTSYVTSLFIQPKNVKSKPVLQSYHIDESNEKKVLVATLKNLGNKHVSLNKYIFTLQSGQDTFEIDQDYILKSNEFITLLPLHERECTIPLPEDLPENFSLESCKVSLKILNSR